MLREFAHEAANLTWYLDTNLAKELEELRQRVFGTSRGRIVCQRCRTTDDNLSPIVSPLSSSSESYFSFGEDGSVSDQSQKETDPDPDADGLQENDGNTAYSVEFNPHTKVTLRLSLERQLTQNGDRTYAAFNMDGKYLATVSDAGRVQIFDVKTAKRLR